MPKVFRRIASYKFNASCKIHDMDYSSSKFTRLQADSRFLVHMMRQARESLLWELAAWAYFILVRITGRLLWKQAKK